MSSDAALLGVRPSEGAAKRPEVLAVTSGEPAGIGPDVCLALARRDPGTRLVVIGDRGLLARRARMLGLEVAMTEYARERQAAAGALEVLHIPLGGPCRPGVLDRANARYVLATIERALDGCETGEFAAMVTAPVHKGILNDGGIPFTGHTEFLAERTGTARVVMMLVGGGLRVALATTHVPLKQVAAAISQEGLEQTLRVLCDSLTRWYAIPAPRVLVAGLNPHAGEGGYLGREEIEIIAPVIERLRSQGYDLHGPLPADTLFTPASLDRADCVLAMYHDQGLPVLKYASFGRGINVTLGLPIVRTSVDHGTALDRAGTGRAEPGSMIAAVQAALDMVAARAAH